MKSAVGIRHVGFADLGAFTPATRSAVYQILYWDIGEHELWTLEPELDRKAQAVLSALLGGLEV